ncbi:MAG: hypothetical protein II931_05995 [Clostridia bacterium]|nr:hypothetical protein [Clostridia bacterium]
MHIFEHAFSEVKEKAAGILSYCKNFLTQRAGKFVGKMWCGDTEQALKADST